LRKYHHLVGKLLSQNLLELQQLILGFVQCIKQDSVRLLNYECHYQRKNLQADSQKHLRSVWNTHQKEFQKDKHYRKDCNLLEIHDPVIQHAPDQGEGVPQVECLVRLLLVQNDPHVGNVDPKHTGNVQDRDNLQIFLELSAKKENQRRNHNKSQSNVILRGQMLGKVSKGQRNKENPHKKEKPPKKLF